ncbi:MAG TPA: TGS domain-containing protein [Candidatus Paceibacterota bacterium]|nr:TGS domain-containing protein [Candidatus Paceibacterota bacterium]HRV32079.1 TGS domain-containing protein [Candidatus Paceibacterota bacterium]
MFVLTPKGDVINLPKGSTPIDFAYKIHSDLGNHCQMAKVNNQIVPLNYQLQSGDIVEIITNKNKKPNRE